MNTSVNFFILSLIGILFNSCGNQSQWQDGHVIFFPDTTPFKKSWEMDERIMLTDVFAKDTLYNQLGLDTFELTYAWCDCPDWIDQSKLHLDCKECSDFYIEPADTALVLPSEFLFNGNTVVFYGVRIPEMRLPQGGEQKTQNAPAWTVVRYYGFEVKRPYRVWGPVEKIFKAPADTFQREVPVWIQ